jgi:hypothetical protein
MKEDMKQQEKDFDAVAFFRDIKERMAKATDGMSLQEKRIYWQKLRDSKIRLA